MEQETITNEDSSMKYLITGLVLSVLICMVDTQIPLGIVGGMLYVVLVILALR